MRVIKAEVLGMCFGVRDALEILADVADPERVTIHGELVHNETVLQQLEMRGFRMTSEQARVALPMTDSVLITAHGISERERRRLLAAGKELIDTTCPLVKRAHDAAQKLQDQGYHVLLIGKRGHVEVQGIAEDLASYDIVQSADEVIAYPHARLGIMCQTTTPATLVEQIRAAVAARNPQAEIRFVDTVCHPTKDHQKALLDLLEQVEAMVVVGGKNSNNTRELVNQCRRHGLPTYHIQGADDLDPAWFAGIETVGLTAGTSTLASTIDEVFETLRVLDTAPVAA